MSCSFLCRYDINLLQILSSTDIKCTWKQLKNPNLQDFEAEPIVNFCCIREKRLRSFSPGIQAEIRRRLVECDTETALSMHTFRNASKNSDQNTLESNRTNYSNPSISEASATVQAYPPRIPISDNSCRIQLSDISNRSIKIRAIEPIDHTTAIITRVRGAKIFQALSKLQFKLLPCCIEKYKNLVLCVDVARVEKKTRDSEKEWRKERQFRVTASRCYSIFTRKKDDWKTFSSLYFWPNSFSNPATRHGKMCEPIARELYAKQTGTFVQQCGLIICEQKPWFGFSVDGVVFKFNKFTKLMEIKLLEIKCPLNLPDTEIKTLKIHCHTYLDFVDDTVHLKKRHIYNGKCNR